ncbi:MAG TPA: hypothetical protein VFK70_02315, partial [Vicinamibacteria bacterium]|nr:hypothetical protein [Vicinamibacteria bacterium]
MAPTRVGSQKRGVLGLVLAWLVAGATIVAAQPAKAPSVLTAVVGPRQGTWTRSFNPFRSDAESRWPTWS